MCSEYYEATTGNKPSETEVKVLSDSYILVKMWGDYQEMYTIDLNTAKGYDSLMYEIDLNNIPEMEEDCEPQGPASDFMAFSDLNLDEDLIMSFSGDKIEEFDDHVYIHRTRETPGFFVNTYTHGCLYDTEVYGSYTDGEYVYIEFYAKIDEFDGGYVLGTIRYNPKKFNAGDSENRYIELKLDVTGLYLESIFSRYKDFEKLYTVIG